MSPLCVRLVPHRVLEKVTNSITRVPTRKEGKSACIGGSFLDFTKSNNKEIANSVSRSVQFYESTSLFCKISF